ncbi:YeiH family protein [Chamaesiphon minutus]|uniref:Conserved hypothetical integral membrane protein n=1 Tax=Chamaesiphon minutus (strain ATCC 27169 / PCC 6605) TaxID=1173020 RepID=K9UE54_CHAP6|nr:YeiH family protein [Chamaesiphon minutus]AFY93387.1 conserved hypothetical integral membrane protein [Chamaesiphon minutus PCC 6605]
MDISLLAQVWGWLAHKSYGILLTIALAIAAYLLRNLSIFQVFSPLIIAILLGIILRNTLGMPAYCQPGVSFAMKRLLRLAIVLLGMQLSLTQVLAIGIRGIGLIIVTLVSTFGFTSWLGRKLGVSKSLTYLIAAGTSICGASAVIATSTAIQGDDRDTTYAVAIVTIFGTLSMFLYPLLPTLLGLTPETFGIWCGASIHEVAQVLAAAYQVSPIGGEIASITKLARVLFLAPVILSIGYTYSHRQLPSSKMRSAAIVIPWFIFYFMLLIILNSLNLFPPDFKSAFAQIDKFLLTIAMAAMGLETKITHLQQVGLKPLYLGALSWLFISGLSYGLIRTFY